MDIQALHFFIRDVGRRIGDHSEPGNSVMGTVLLALHVVCLDSSYFAVFSRQVKNLFGLVHMDMDFGLSFCTGQYQ